MGTQDDKYGKKKLLWFNHPQLQVLEDIKNITNESNSLIVRKALNLYLASLQSK